MIPLTIMLQKKLSHFQVAVLLFVTIAGCLNEAITNNYKQWLHSYL